MQRCIFNNENNEDKCLYNVIVGDYDRNNYNYCGGGATGGTCHGTACDSMAYEGVHQEDNGGTGCQVLHV